MNRILFTTHALPWAHPFPLFPEADEVDLGVQFKTVRENGRLKFLSTLHERFDLAAIPAIARGEFSPEIILVHTDATMGCLPRNIAAIPAMRVLLVGDTHHLTAPIQKMVAYAFEEKFEHVVVWNRQHAHFFTEAGVKHVHWLPGLFFRVPDFPHALKRENKAVFFGQIGRYHPRRRAITLAIAKHDLPFQALTKARSEGLTWTSSATIGFNCSLNSEFNLRIMETLAAGSLLITDRLAPETGMDEIFEEGRDYLAYDNADEACEKIRWAIDHPDEAAIMASRAHDKYQEFFSLEARKSQLLDILTFADKDGPFALAREPRTARRIRNSPDAQLLSERVVGYEVIQELHRDDGILNVLCLPSAPPEILSDLADLPRVRLHIPTGEQGEALFARLAPALQKRVTLCDDIHTPEWRIAIATFATIRTDANLHTLIETRSAQYLWLVNAPESAPQTLAGYERAAGKICFQARASLRRPVITKTPEPILKTTHALAAPLPTRKNTRALVTLAVGNRFESLFEEHCRENWQAYADRHGYDLIVLTRPLDNSPRALSRSGAWQKCLICEQPETAGYERLVWIDADVIINPDSPDICASVPAEKIGAVNNDASPTPELRKVVSDRMSKRWTEITSPLASGYDPQRYYTNWGLPRLPKNEGVVQTGVFVVSPKHHATVLRHVYDNYEDKGDARWNYEMPPLSWEIVSRGLAHWIDPRFNTISAEAIALHYPFLFEELHAAARDTENLLSYKNVQNAFRTTYHNTFFLHFAGMKDLLKILRGEEATIPGVDPLAEKHAALTNTP